MKTNLRSRASLSALAASLLLAAGPAEAIGLTTPFLTSQSTADLLANVGAVSASSSGPGISVGTSAFDQADVPLPVGEGTVQVIAQGGSYMDNAHVSAAFGQMTGRGTASGRSGFTQTVTNDTAGRVRVDYTFVIDAGIGEYYGFFDYTQTLPRPDGNSHVALDLKVNNVSTVSGAIDGLFTTVPDGNAPDGFVRNASYTRGGIMNSLTNFQVNGATATWDQSVITVTLTELDPNQSFDFGYALLAGVQVTAAACTGSVGIGCLGLRMAVGDPNEPAINVTNLGFRFTALDGDPGGKIPEPATLAVACAGLAGLGLARRRRKA